MEQQTGSKLGKEYVKTINCHPAYLTYKQSTSYEMLAWKTLSITLLACEMSAIVCSSLNILWRCLSLELE